MTGRGPHCLWNYYSGSKTKSTWTLTFCTTQSMCVSGFCGIMNAVTLTKTHTHTDFNSGALCLGLVE